MKTILYIVSTLESSGPTNQLLGIIRGLDRGRFNPQILTLSPEPSSSQIGDFISCGVPVTSLGMSRAKMHLKGHQNFIEMVDKIRPDIIHSYGLRPDLYVGKLLVKYRRMSTIHCCLTDVYTSFYGYFIGRVASALHISALHHFDSIVACSFTVGRYLIEKSIGEPVVIHNGVDDTCFKRANNETKLALRRKLGIPPNAFVFITTGHLSKLKDPLTAIRGFKKNAKGKFDQALLILLGSGKLMDNCRSEADLRIILPGRVDNVSEWLKTADAYISASHMEGMPYSVLEAMASGLPVVLSDIEAHKEIVEKSGNIGILFRTGQVDDLSDALQRLTETDITEMSSRALGAVDTKFGFRIMSQKYQKEYLNMLSGA